MSELAEELARELSRHVENVVVFDEIDSTHGLALRLIDQVDSEGLTLQPTVVCALAQSRGVGRGSRRWVSPPGGLYLNWVASGVNEAVLGKMPMLAAAAALAAVSEAGVQGAAIKWPNDILVQGRKLAGILVHARRGEVICLTVGLGVNVAPLSDTVEDALHEPVSLAELIGEEAARTRASAVAARFVAELTTSLRDPDPALDRWSSSLIHRPGDAMSVRVATGSIISGEYAGLTPEGHLRLLDASGAETILTGGDVMESSEP